MLDIAIVTLVIIAANVIISLKGFNDFSFFEKYKFNIASIRRGEQIRMLTSGFLHVDTTHLLFNMLTLYFFANIVLNALGTVRKAYTILISKSLNNPVKFFVEG